MAQSTANQSTTATATAIPTKDKATAKGNAAKATTGKTKKVNPIKEARKNMLKSVKEERQSLGDCLRLLAMKGGNWIKLMGLTPKQFGGLTPSDLRPFQTENERFKAVLIDATGDMEKVESGWTPTKVANAVERMQAAKVATVAAK